MIRKIYLDLARERLSRGDAGWAVKRGWQYLMTHLSFLTRRPLCGPLLGTLVTNYTCTYHCLMCDLPLRDRELRQRGLREYSTGEMKALIRQFAELGTAGIGFTGGEPLLRSDLFELLGYAARLGMITHLNSNAFLLDRRNAGLIIEAGVDSLNISLDGALPETHNRVRRHPEAFERVIGAVAAVNEARRRSGSRLRLKLVAVIDQGNIGEVPALVSLSRDLGADCVEFIPRQPFLVPDGRPAPPPDEDFLEAVRRTADWLLSARKSAGCIENSPGMIRLFESSFRGLPSPLTCYAGYNSLTVDCYGEIYPCLPWANWRRAAGNASGTTLTEFWRSPAYAQRRREISRCRDCYLNCQAELNILFNPSASRFVRR